MAPRFPLGLAPAVSSSPDAPSPDAGAFRTLAALLAAGLLLAGCVGSSQRSAEGSSASESALPSDTADASSDTLNADLENASALEGSGVYVNSRYDGFATVRAEVAELAQIASGPAVSYVARGSVNYATNNEGVVRTGAALLHDDGYIENTEYKGEGAIVCVYDSGIDIDHGDFRDEEGQTRL